MHQRTSAIPRARRVVASEIGVRSQCVARSKTQNAIYSTSRHRVDTTRPWDGSAWPRGTCGDEAVASVERPDAIARIRTMRRATIARCAARARILESLALSLRCQVVALELSSRITRPAHGPAADAEELLRVGSYLTGADTATLQETIELTGYGPVGAVRFDRDASLPWTAHERLLASSGARAILHQFECLVECQRRRGRTRAARILPRHRARARRRPFAR